MHILSLQPYFGGSHKAFQLGWRKHSCHQWTVLTLPPRHWKWRMRHAAVHFAEQLASEFSNQEFDAIFCSDFLNVAEFKGLVHESIRRLPVVLYFHENQFAYPSRRHDERDLHFGFTNFTSCLASDQVWFNSVFNRDSFVSGLERACQKWPDFQPKKSIDSLQAKIRIEPPGISSRSRAAHRISGSDPLMLVWAARWEHDKNPALLLDVLQQLQQRNIDFRISVIGQSFRRVPDEFDQIHEQFSHHIDRWGFQPTHEDYWRTLAETDVFLSTANHEFFGIAAAEAVIGGAIPLLPNRLAYPELIRVERESKRQELFLYDGTASDAAEKLEYICRHRDTEFMQQTRKELQAELTGELGWQTRAPLMDEQIKGICASGCPIG